MLAGINTPFKEKIVHSCIENCTYLCIHLKYKKNLLSNYKKFLSIWKNYFKPKSKRIFCYVLLQKMNVTSEQNQQYSPQIIHLRLYYMLESIFSK